MNSDELIISENDYARLSALARGHRLAAELDKSIVVPAERMPNDVVVMNSRVIYVDENVGTRREIELVYPDEANPAEGRISILAPVGSALLGLSAGRSIDWEYPGGEIHRLQVERVMPQYPAPFERRAHRNAKGAGK